MATLVRSFAELHDHSADVRLYLLQNGIVPNGFMIAVFYANLEDGFNSPQADLNVTP